MARISKLLGPDGQPIIIDELEQERAGPTLTGVRSAISGHPADGLTPARLAAIHRAAAQGEMQAYLELAEDIEERDAHYAAVLGTRKRQVSQLQVTIEAASDDPAHVKHADFLREWLKIGVLDAALFDMLDAVGKGFSVMEIEWECLPERIIPSALIYRPQRWFALDETDKDTPVLSEGVTKTPLAPHKFIFHKHPAKSGLMIRSGIARIASWTWMYKAFTLKDWAIFVQNYGMPIRIGTYDQSATDQQKKVLWSAIANIAGDCAAMIPKGMDIRFEQAGRGSGGKGDELYERRSDWCDRQISKVVLGQTTTTDAISGGHAVSKEHREVQEDIERADAKLVSATLTRQLAPMIIALNFGPQPVYPKISIGRPDEVALTVVIDALAKLGPQGLTVGASALRDRLGFEDPGVDEQVVGGRLDKMFDQANQQRASAFPVLHQKQPEDPTVEIMTARLAREASGAMAGLTDEIRQIFEEAKDLHEAADKLANLNLNPSQLAEAMARGMALAHLAGQAALLDEAKNA